MIITSLIRLYGIKEERQLIAWIVFIIILLILPTNSKHKNRSVKTPVCYGRIAAKKPESNNSELIRALQDQLQATTELGLQFDKSADNIHNHTLAARKELTKAVQSKKRVKELEKQASENNILKAARLRKSAMDMYCKAASIQARIDKLQSSGT